MQCPVEFMFYILLGAFSLCVHVMPCSTVYTISLCFMFCFMLGALSLCQRHSFMFSQYFMKSTQFTRCIVIMCTLFLMYVLFFTFNHVMPCTVYNVFLCFTCLVMSFMFYVLHFISCHALYSVHCFLCFMLC